MAEKANSPGVILKSKYVFSKNKFSEYINYIDRPAAVRSNAYGLYSVYADYLDNPAKRSPGFNPESKKASPIFTATKDQLTMNEKRELKKRFSIAQKNDSPMWQQVISFTNDFLEKYGLYDSKTGRLDEDKIRFVTRLAMQEELKDEKMDGAAVWSAAVHYNTDNIHIHIAIVEPYPTRTRKEFSVWDKDGTRKRQVQFKGSMSKKTFLGMKSKVVNNIVDRAPELTKINDIIRKDIVAEKRNHSSSRDKKLRGAFLNLYTSLPQDKRLWQYNMNALTGIRPQIDDFTKLYIDLYHHDDYKDLLQSLNEQQAFLKSVYGSGKQELYKDYAKTKIQDLYTRMGNAVLHELKEYSKSMTAAGRVHSQKQPYQKHLPRSAAGIYNLKKALKKDYESAKNQTAYERLQQDIEQEEER